MASDKDLIDTPIEESNIDHINTVITNSEESMVDEMSEPREDIHEIESDVYEEKENAEEKSNKIPIKNIKDKIVVAQNTAKIVKDEKKVELKKPVIKKYIQTPIAHEVHHEHKQVKSVPVKKAEVVKPVAITNIRTTPISHNNLKKHDSKPEPKKEVLKKIIPAKKPVIIVKKNPIKFVPIKISKTTKHIKSVHKTKNNHNNFKEDKMKNHKEHKKNGKSTKNKLLWIGISVLAVILIAALIFVFSPIKFGNNANNQTNNSVAATVNGEPIYLQDVLKTYNDLSPLVKQSYSIESVLNKSIDEVLLYQEAKALDLSVSTAEIDAQITAIKIQNQLSDKGFDDALAQQGLTLDKVKDLIGKDIIVQKLFNATILKNITVTQDDILKYYILNTDKFQVPAQVTVQHILVMVGPNVTENQSKAKIEQVKSELTNSNFCDLVTKYSDDSGSKNTCGKYTFGRGDFNNPEFENPSFSLGINETAIVKTVFGYHLIKKLESIPASTKSVSEVSDIISKTLHDQIAQKNFETLMKDLRSKAVVVNYIVKTDANGTVNIPKSNNLDDFAKCLTEKNATFYGASWCSHCKNQKILFGESMQYIKYIECDVAGQPQVQTSECTNAGISGYPTWIINGKSYPGEQTIAGLAKLTGCAAPQ